MPLVPGFRLGAYEIIAPLGAGGMGEVWRARDPRLGREVAIKVLPAEFAADPDRLARFRREAQALAALQHPNIATIHGLEEADGVPFLVLELVEGTTLAAHLAGPLPPREAIAIGVQVAAAIEAAHERGIIHRDLKPANIMVGSGGRVKVLDFGLVRFEETGGDSAARTMAGPAGATQVGIAIGTAAYMSPEQARGKAIDRRTDVWSFGCVLFECVSGRPAFAGETSSDLLARILERDPEWSALPPGTPAKLRELLKRCLRKDAEARPRDIRDVRVELGELAAAAGAAGATALEPAIAVLPFENMSGVDDEYFADGITDEILNALSALEGLRVAARTSSFAFKGRREDLRAIAEKLDVSTVLEGTVRRAGSRLRITAQLVNAADGYQLWSERYDREMTDVFDLQEEIARAIAVKLRGTFQVEAPGAPARRGTKNLDAYELFLRGRTLQLKRGRFLREAMECFERAIELDPEYADPLAWLSDSWRLLGTFCIRAPNEAMPKARALAEKAIALDPAQVEAWGTLAAVNEQFDWDYASAHANWERAFALDPRHARGRMQRALWAFVGGLTGEASVLAEAARALEDDPLNAWVVAMHSQFLGLMKRHEESLREAERAVALDSDSFFAQWNLLRALAYTDRVNEVIVRTPQVFEASGRNTWALGVLAFAYGRVGDPGRARAIHTELVGRAGHEFVGPSWLAIAASAGGLDDEAMAHAEACVVARDPVVTWIEKAMLWEHLRAHPRYPALVKAVWP